MNLQSQQCRVSVLDTQRPKSTVHLLDFLFLLLAAAAIAHSETTSERMLGQCRAGKLNGGDFHRLHTAAVLEPTTAAAGNAVRGDRIRTSSSWG